MKKKLRITSNFQKNITISEQELKQVKAGNADSGDCCGDNNFYTFTTTSFGLPICKEGSNPKSKPIQ